MSRQRGGAILFLLFMCVFPLHSQSSTILVDFGSNPSPAPWINISNTSTGAVQNLPDAFGIPTDISLNVFDAFNGINTNGTQNPDPNLDIPNTASGDSFFGNTVTFSGRTESTGGIRLANLETEKEYTLTIFASRDATDNRETQYTFTGATKDSAFLNVAGNKSSVVTFSDYPSAEGVIEIIASPGPNNNNSYHFFYLGALIVDFESDNNVTPELQLVQPTGGEIWQVGKKVDIKWKSTTKSSTTVDYSTDGGTTWTKIGAFTPFEKSYEWLVPDTPSENCLVRVTSDTLVDQSESPFEISSQSGTCTLVVLGSSTAEGTGASTPDSGWVSRYRNTVYVKNTRHEVVNLARGGYTTYHLLPTGSTAGSSVGVAVDTQRNITKALTFDPVGIIINLPSNDAANNYPAKDQLTNFATMVNEAEAQGVPVWICTTQPRNFSNASQIQLQKQVRDSVFSIYGDYALDFWNGIAQDNGYILEAYDSGDGVHLNDTGHGFLYRTVMENVNWDKICDTGTTVQTLKAQPHDMHISVYPNPFNLHTTLKFDLPVAGAVEIHIFNIMGQNIKTLANQNFNSGSHEIVWDGTDNQNRIVNSGAYFFRVQAGEFIKIEKGLIIK